ncbi:bifunctional salicylyl-CoA 5-hydroxylase/oxidoreductase [Streptomyces sp. H10-C2]|uniref:bifunctional salicylyl-CoA 5-hydroxylase/oxidoreductase n=1 Tax=unclassified Streptomyces TaxID=2593676 RepID=UPI0024BB6F57|nr:MULTISPECIES: bifunctional salicylyl-CoA 5-hydroxylase/oxidoreductase [unclassified Streptomyces]MDJ0345853.1 bifunctional salicylyl-CoA 5-hydroxylase/oxidoreductase [Streptomyces sp. PH10-H1]MDJ0371181.1 bifunctional salicylyl-CoA 5-hydroxylase/oxidoreductase [Streptomyces sp. H10-C2]
MRVAVIGGGPGGLYFAALAKQLSPLWEVTVWERNAPDDTFGFGVVFSDETLDGIAQADPEIFDAMSADFARWSDIDVRYKDRVLTSGGHGFAAVGRKRLLQILQERCATLDVDVRYRTPAPPVAELAAEYDLVVACDGVRSATRDTYAETFVPDLDERHSRYMWLGTDKVFEAFTFIVAEQDFGTLQVHAYPFDDTRSTFIVEMDEDAWRRAGFEKFAARDHPPGTSDEDSIRLCEEILAGHLDGHRLLPNNSKWIRFTTVRNRTWRHDNVVLLGDAAHTAHFSIGSGTKLAMEDALALAACLHEHPGVSTALTAYEAERKPVVESTQRAAQASLEWFENIGRYTGQDPHQFAFNLLTRSRRVTYDNLRERDEEFTSTVDSWHTTAHTAITRPTGTSVPPMFRPFQLGGLHLRNRVVVPPTALYTARDGIPGEFELVHLSTQALGGSGLVFAGMTAVSPQGRATPGCPGLYSGEQEAAWRRITDFVHRQSDTCVGIQLTHAGRRAATGTPGRDGRCAPLGDEGWPLIAASPLAWDAASTLPREATRDDMDHIVRDFVSAAERADRAGFDALELQYGHGHLMSGFLSPLTNVRADVYGGSLGNRLRFPLEVLRAVRAAWPAGKALIIRISAADWAEGGTSEADAVAIARALADAGADAVDISTGEVVAHERPRYGRSYQTPYADLVRNATRIPTIAVGAISTYDDVNSIILAGRADLCAVGRAQLHDPLWTLHAAAAQNYTGPAAPWPPSWTAGSGKPPGARSDRIAPRLQLLREPAAPVHQRWLPHSEAAAPAPATAR